MMDHVIPKPELINGYSLHRMVAGLAAGSPALFCDNGDHILIRTDKPITKFPRSVNIPSDGDVIAFRLKACVADRKGGRNIYPAIGDWRTRRAWLDAQGSKEGFDVLAVHVDGNREHVTASSGRKFWIDSTSFTGVLKVTDPVKFSSALVRGVGRVGKAFGNGMLVI